MLVMMLGTGQTSSCLPGSSRGPGTSSWAPDWAMSLTVGALVITRAGYRSLLGEGLGCGLYWPGSLRVQEVSCLGTSEGAQRCRRDGAGFGVKWCQLKTLSGLAFHVCGKLVLKTKVLKSEMVRAWSPTSCSCLALF